MADEKNAVQKVIEHVAADVAIVAVIGFVATGGNPLGALAAIKACSLATAADTACRAVSGS